MNYRLIQSNQNLCRIFCGNQYSDSKVFTEKQRNWNRENNLKKNKVRETTLPDFEPHSKATLIETMWCWTEDSHAGAAHTLMGAKCQISSSFTSWLMSKWLLEIVYCGST